MKYIQIPVQMFFDIMDAIDEIPDENKTQKQRMIEIDLLDKMTRIERHIKYGQKRKGTKANEN